MNAEEAKQLGHKHGTLLHPFDAPEVDDDGTVYTAYLNAFNLGLHDAVGHVLKIHEENKALKDNAGTATINAAVAEQTSVEQEELEARKYGASNMDMENHRRVKAGLKALSYAEFVARSVRLMKKREQEEPRRQKDIDAMMGV